MSGLQLDFVVYLGDPDEGAEALKSADLLANAEAHKSEVSFPDAYGALTVRRGDEDLLTPLPDPIFGLITNVVRAVPYVLDGESETLQWSETEHGASFEPSGDDVLVSFFMGDQYEPDEYLLQEAEMTLAEFGTQVVAMGERLEGIIKKIDPTGLEEDDYLKGISEFLEVARDAAKNYRLQKQHGLRS